MRFSTEPVLWLLARVLVRRRGDPAAPVERRRRAARRRLARELKRTASAGEQTRAVVRFLSARTRDADQAWLGRSLAALHDRRRGGFEVKLPDGLSMDLLETTTPLLADALAHAARLEKREFLIGWRDEQRGRREDRLRASEEAA